MQVHEALRLRLIADATVAALIEARIYPAKAPQSAAKPTIFYKVLNTEDEETHSGVADIARTSIRFSASSQSYDEAKELSEAIRLCLQDFSGTVTDTDASPDETLEINGIFRTNTDEFYHDPTQTHHVLSDFDVWAYQQQPTQP